MIVILAMLPAGFGGEGRDWGMPIPVGRLMKPGRHLVSRSFLVSFSFLLCLLFSQSSSQHTPRHGHLPMDLLRN